MIGFTLLPIGRLRASSSAVLLLFALASLPCASQSDAGVDKFFRNNIGLSDEQIASIRSGNAVVKELPSRTPAEVFLFGAVYVHASPAAYLNFVADFSRLRKLPGYLALGVFSKPPQLSDLRGFSFDDDDVNGLKSCKPGNCPVQMPASSMEQMRQSVNWSASDVNQQVNELLRKTALEQLLLYQRDGNQSLGVYDDKGNPTDVSKQFAAMLSYTKVLPETLPDFYRYLLAYPNSRPANVEDVFYWAKVKFGLKPTLRVLQRTTMRGSPGDAAACAVAEKQLYSSHYFETALDLTFCVPSSGNGSGAGFYLIREMGSEQAGLTGPKGAVVRKAAIHSSISNLQKALNEISKDLPNQ